MDCRRRGTLGALVAVLCVQTSCVTYDSGAFAVTSAAPVERLYDSNRIFALELSAPFRAVFSERGEERTYRPASLRFRDQAGVEHDVSVEIRIRGNYRARPSICAFPMLRLRVSKKGGRGTVFEGQKRLRLVTHCRASGDYEQSLLLEYLAYRMYTVLSDASVRTRLVAIRYVDTTRPNARAVTRFGFFVEDVRAVARRLGTRRHKDSPGDRAYLDSRVLNRLEVYQYMLGNTDWSPVGSEPGDACCHNVFLLKGTPIVPIPYDFDMSGFVSAGYATPNPELGIRSVRQRFYQGGCITNDELAETVAFFRSARDQILAPLRAQQGLSRWRRARALSYLDGFFEMLGDPRAVERQLLRRCLS